MACRNVAALSSTCPCASRAICAHRCKECVERVAARERLAHHPQRALVVLFREQRSLVVAPGRRPIGAHLEAGDGGCLASRGERAQRDGARVFPEGEGVAPSFVERLLEGHRAAILHVPRSLADGPGAGHEYVEVVSDRSERRHVPSRSKAVHPTSRTCIVTWARPLRRAIGGIPVNEVAAAEDRRCPAEHASPPSFLHPGSPVYRVSDSSPRPSSRRPRTPPQKKQSSLVSAAAQQGVG